MKTINDFHLVTQMLDILKACKDQFVFTTNENFEKDYDLSIKGEVGVFRFEMPDDKPLIKTIATLSIDWYNFHFIDIDNYFTLDIPRRTNIFKNVPSNNEKKN